MSGPGRPSPLARVLLAVVAGYRRGLSPLLGPRCRFAPTCSAYAVEALTVHGALRGTGLVLRRLVRCQPFHPGGPDPVPPPRRRSATMDAQTAPTAGAPARPTRPAAAARGELPC